MYGLVFHGFDYFIGKLQEHDMDMKRLVIDEEGHKKKKSLLLKAEEEKRL